MAAALILTVGGGCAAHGSAPHAHVPNVLRRADLTRGKAVYEAQCQACHGSGGSGGLIGPALHEEHVRRPYRAVYAIVSDPAPPMPKLYPGTMTRQDVRDVSAYVESL